MAQKILETQKPQTVNELIESLQDWLRVIGQDGDVVYIESGENGDAEFVELRLIEQTLTDGSIVYNVRII